MNYAEFTMSPLQKKIYIINCFNDMGHFNYTVNGKSSFETPKEISDFVFNHIYKNYIEHYYIKHDNNITTMHYRLKKDSKRNGHINSFIMETLILHMLLLICNNIFF